MKRYCVVYMVYGTYYRFRCSTSTKREAKAECAKAMDCKLKDIVEVYEENN